MCPGNHTSGTYANEVKSHIQKLLHSQGQRPTLTAPRTGSPLWCASIDEWIEKTMTRTCVYIHICTQQNIDAAVILYVVTSTDLQDMC